MTAILSFWVAEFALEVSGALLNRKRSTLLASILAFCALSDAITFCIFFSATADPVIYGTCYWAARCFKYLLLIWLACSICGMFVQERRKSMAVISTAFLSIGSASIITVVSATGETLKNKLLDGEITANCILLAFVAVGWISRREKLNQAWKFIAAGFIVMVGSDLLFTALWMGWDGARHLYPIGAISAQILWCVGPLKTVKLGEFRKSLEQKFPEVEKVTVI